MRNIHTAPADPIQLNIQAVSAPYQTNSTQSQSKLVRTLTAKESPEIPQYYLICISIGGLSVAILSNIVFLDIGLNTQSGNLVDESSIIRSKATRPTNKVAGY
jgi:hypothetical protein